MKNLTIILGLLVFTFAGSVFSSEVASTDTVTFSFKHSDVTLHTQFPDMGATDIKVGQGTLVEKDPSGKVIQKFKLKSQSGTWSPVVLTDGIYTTSYDSNSKEFGMSAKTTVHSGVLTTSKVESVLCTQCSGGSTGVCQNGASLACKSPSSSGRCPRRFFPCSDTITVEKSTFTYSLEITWKFQHPENTLHYELKLDTKKPKIKGKHAKTESISLKDFPGFLDIPTNAVVYRANGEKHIVNVKANLESSEKKNTISWEFPSFEAGDKLYYQ